MILQGSAAQHNTVTVQMDVVSRSKGANKYDRKLKIGIRPRQFKESEQEQCAPVVGKHNNVTITFR